MSRTRDLEQGSAVEPERNAVDEESAAAQHERHIDSGMNNPSGNDDPNRSHESHKDFDNNANPLWSLYMKEVKIRDEARIQTLKDDMDGILLFAGLFSSVLSAFVVPKIQDLKGDPTSQLAYYQQQSVEILSQISQQIASIGSQSSVNPTPPLPYPTFRPSASDRRVNVYWLISLICSLSAALLATLVQQWVRAYMRIYQRSGNPLKTARIQVFLYEGVEHLPMVAEAVPGFIHLSLILFFLGLGDAVLNVHTIVGVTTVIPIVICGFLYLYCTVSPAKNPQLPYRNPFSGAILRLVRILRLPPYNRPFPGEVVKPMNIDAIQEHLAMEETKGRKDRDVCAIQWLIDNINKSDKMETFVLTFPGFFDQDLGQEVWKVISIQGASPPNMEMTERALPTDIQVYPRLGLRSLQEGTPIYDLCRFVRSVLETYNNGDSTSKEVRRRRMHGCVETVACLVCCADIPLSWFGRVEGVLSELGRDERIKDPLTIRSNPAFAVRWTCLSLVGIQRMIYDSQLPELAGFAVSGIARFQEEYGTPDAVAFNGAQKIDDYLKRAWEHVEDLHRAFEPWSLNRTEEDIKKILLDCEESISKLERIQVEASGVEQVDWRMSLLQDAMDNITHRLIRQLPGLSFHEVKSDGPISICTAFAFPSAGITPVTPQFIFPGQQLGALCTLGRRLRDIIDGQNLEQHKEILDSLESVGKIPVPVRRLNHLMTRQLWRLQDLRDGHGFGLTIELFFHAFRLLSSLAPESKTGSFLGTLNVITSHWMDSENSIGTQRILLNLICDLVVQGRGVFSDFPYPTDIVDELLEIVGKMPVIDGPGGPHRHINDAVRELRDFNPGIPGESVDETLHYRAVLRDKTLEVIRPLLYALLPT